MAGGGGGDQGRTQYGHPSTLLVKPSLSLRIAHNTHRESVKPEHVLEFSEKDKCQMIWSREVRQHVHKASTGLNHFIVFLSTKYCHFLPIIKIQIHSCSATENQQKLFISESMQ